MCARVDLLTLGGGVGRHVGQTVLACHRRHVEYYTTLLLSEKVINVSEWFSLVEPGPTTQPLLTAIDRCLLEHLYSSQTHYIERTDKIDIEDPLESFQVARDTFLYQRLYKQ